MKLFEELAQLGVATIHEVMGRRGLVDADLIQIVPNSRAAGPARTVRNGQGDNLMVHAALSQVQPGEVLVLAMPEAAPVALLGELIAVQAAYRQVAAVLVDGAVRDVEELARIGLPVWARWIRATGATKDILGTVNEPVTVGGSLIRDGHSVVLDGDGAVVIPQSEVNQVLLDARARARHEDESRQRFKQGVLTYDLSGLRAKDESPGRSQRLH